MVGKSPNTYAEWTLALVEMGAVVSVDASKIDLREALSLVRKLPMNGSGVQLKFYNCGSIPWNLLDVAQLGGSSIEIQM